MVAAAQSRRIAMVVASALAITIPATAAVIRVPSGHVYGADGLVAAIRAANNTSEPDKIVLAPGTYRLNRVIDSPDGPIGLPTIFGALTITTDSFSDVPAAIIERTTGAQDFRILRVSENGALTLVGVTVRSGTTDDFGGGLLNRGRSTLINSIVTQNTARSGGGGISNRNNADRGPTARPGVLVVASSAITCNVAGFFGGGGILNEGTLVFTDSILSFNTADNFEPVSPKCGDVTRVEDLNGGGGGLMNRGTATLEHSLVSSNVGNFTVAETTGGGGIANFAGATLSVTNTTISGNLAKSQGGGIDNAGSLSLRFVTIADNLVVQPEGTARGGGIRSETGDFADTPPASLFVENSIVIDNRVRSGSAQPIPNDCDGMQMTSGGHNLFGNPGGRCGFTKAVGDQVEPFAAPGSFFDPLPDIQLGHTGGITPTHALFLSGSGNPAIDGANPLNCPATDQRRLARPIPFGFCDIGAYEAFSEPRTTTIDPGEVIKESMVLTQDHPGGITIGQDGIELDCNGKRIIGVGRGTGIELIGRRQVTIRNCDVQDFNNGISVEDSAGNLFVQNTVSGSRNDGVHIVRSAGNIIEMAWAKENGDDGFDFETTTASVVVSSEASRNTGNGFIVGLSSVGNLFVGTIIHGNGGRGLRVRQASSDSLFMQNFSCNNASTDVEENSHPNFFHNNTFCSEEGIRPREKF
jgi:parallel beta-helix repeat protein